MCVPLDRGHRLCRGVEKEEQLVCPEEWTASVRARAPSTNDWLRLPRAQTRRTAAHRRHIRHHRRLSRPRSLRRARLLTWFALSALCSFLGFLLSAHSFGFFCFTYAPTSLSFASFISGFALASIPTVSLRIPCF